jgi:hypothetical protein
MNGDPGQFETIGSRLGFRIVNDTATAIELTWRGPRFPAFLCLGIAGVLLAVSIPIVQAIQLRGFTGAAGSLWYFPLMNIVLFGIAIYLITQHRTISIDAGQKRVTLQRRSAWRVHRLTLDFTDIARIVLGTDRVESGFALAGSTASQAFPVPSLRIVTVEGGTVLLDRGSQRRLEELAQRIGAKLGRAIDTEAA